MRLVVRADGSEKIGAGHIMRTSSVAQEMLALGIEVVYVGNISKIPWLRLYLENLGIKAIYEHEELYIHAERHEILLIDSYTESSNSKFLQKSDWYKVAVLGDSFTPKYDCDLWFDISLADRNTNEANFQCYSGIEYFPVRKIHYRKRSNFYSRIFKDPKILVIGGATDINYFAENIASALVKIKFKGNVTFVTQSDEIRNFNKKFKRVDYFNLENDQISNFDGVICTSSTTSFEMLACNIPMAVVCATENQKAYYDWFSKHRLASTIGEFEIKNGWVFDFKSLSSFLLRLNIVRKQNNKNHSLRQYNGSKNIAKVLQSLFELEPQ
jgi:spore coat polysaccharide biosynthesis predicted glycosyltransferase SpsG